MTLEELWKPIFLKGYESQFEGDLKTLHSDGRILIGRAVTCTFVPSRPDLHETMFAAGAGAVGNYDCCCFQVCGRGQFRPLVGSDPFIGAQGRVEHVTEWKLEMICPEGRIRDVIAALKEAHPYETPAFQHWSVEME